MHHSVCSEGDQDIERAAPLLHADFTVKLIDLVYATVLLKFRSEGSAAFLVFKGCALFIISLFFFGPSTLSLQGLFHAGVLLCVCGLISVFFDLLYLLPISLIMDRRCKNRIVLGPQEVLFFADKLSNRSGDIQHDFSYRGHWHTWKVHSYIFIFNKFTGGGFAIHVRDFKDREAFDQFFCRVQDIFKYAEKMKQPTPRVSMTATSKFPRSGRDDKKPIGASPSVQC